MPQKNRFRVGDVVRGDPKRTWWHSAGKLAVVVCNRPGGDVLLTPFDGEHWGHPVYCEDGGGERKLAQFSGVNWEKDVFLTEARRAARKK